MISIFTICRNKNTSSCLIKCNLKIGKWRDKKIPQISMRHGEAPQSHSRTTFLLATMFGFRDSKFLFLGQSRPYLTPFFPLLPSESIATATLFVIPLHRTVTPCIDTHSDLYSYSTITVASYSYFNTIKCLLFSWSYPFCTFAVVPSDMTARMPLQKKGPPSCLCFCYG